MLFKKRIYGSRAAGYLVVETCRLRVFTTKYAAVSPLLLRNMS